MDTLDPIPEVNSSCLFYTNGQITKKTEYKATIKKVYPFALSDRRFIYKYDDWAEEAIVWPLMDLWMEAKDNLFWLLNKTTDYIIEISVPELCPNPIFVARSIDGGWQSFDIVSLKEFGILDVTGKYHNELKSS